MKVFVCGHNGLLGSALVRCLSEPEFSENEFQVLTASRQQLDLRNATATLEFLQSHKPDAVIMAAARVGGIIANSKYPAEFIYDNLAIQQSLIEGSHRTGVSRLVFLSSSCVLPKKCPQPMSLQNIGTGHFEPTNAAYAHAKVAGMAAVNAYRQQYDHRWFSVVPATLYGPNDNFDLNNSHVLPALVRRFDEAKKSQAKSIVLWGSGEPRREFMYVDDAARAILKLMVSYDGDSAVPIGVGTDFSIREMAEIVAQTVGYSGEILWDTSKPDGMARKLLDREDFHFEIQNSLQQGIEKTYSWYQECENIRGVHR